MKRGKKYQEAAKLIDKTVLYDVADACSLVKKTSTAKFDETIEAHFRMGLDGVFTPGAIDYMPKVSIAVPLDLELHLVEPAYLSLGGFYAVNHTAKVNVVPDLGVRVGAGCRIWDLDVSFHYNVGILNFNKGDIVGRVSASALTLTVGYCF